MRLPKRRIKRVLNGLGHRLRPHRGRGPILFIVGFQRSGTSILSECFDNDPRVRSYGEYGLAATPGEGPPRLIPRDALRTYLDQAPEPISVVKPLVESQWTPELLASNPRASAVWLYRNFKSVGASNVKKFPDYNSSKLLSLICEGSDSHWVSERVSSETRDKVQQLSVYAEAPHDQMALVWLARNRLVKDHDLASQERLRLIKYDDLIQDPGAYFRGIYDFIDMPAPDPRAYASMHRDSARKGHESPIHPEIAAACQALEDELDALRTTF